jgi:hypothetical protein
VQCNATDKVELYDAVTNQKLKFDGKSNRYSEKKLPRNFLVRGIQPSKTMRDVEISVDIVGGAKKVAWIAFTVLWVDPITVDWSGTESPFDNYYSDYVKSTKTDSLPDGTDKLGLQHFNLLNSDRFGWAYEVTAVVHPKNFAYPDSDLHLYRYMRKASFIGSAPDPDPLQTRHGNDTSAPEFRDDTPDPQGRIYDNDAPGFHDPYAKDYDNQPWRRRWNMDEWATITIDKKAIRCSPLCSFYIRFSVIASPDKSQWQRQTVPDVKGDDKFDYGTTPLTWNLQKENP